MVKVSKESQKRQRKRRIKYFMEDTLRYAIGFPIYYLIIKPYEFLKSKIIKIRDNYYMARFEKVESKAMEEMKRHAAKHLGSTFKSCSITENGTYERDEDICVKDFLKKSTFRYREKGRKYSMLYGKLFPEKIEENHLKYMNELVIWFIEEGCEIKHFKGWSGNSRVDFLMGKLPKDESILLKNSEFKRM